MIGSGAHRLPYPFDFGSRWGVTGEIAVINVDYPALLDLIAAHRIPKRVDSAAFLIWYLENYYRLDKAEAVEAVCDKANDKGVDGIWVNDGDSTITVFQSRIKEDPKKKMGDAQLRTFAGTLRQFETEASLNNLIAGAGDAEVAALVKRLELTSKIGRYTVRGEFISNINVDGNGTNYLNSVPEVTFIGKEHLETTYISASRDLPVHARVHFDISGYDVTKYMVDSETKAFIAPVRANELVRLRGIADQSLFAPNVRGPLGKTAVNKAIVKSIQDHAKHKLFPLFHNGVTVIAKKVAVRGKLLSIEGYFVVNGCQSLTALYANQGALTDELRILTKFIQLKENSTLADEVTQFSNNQNGVKARDFMANHPIQIRLQNEFRHDYRGQYSFEIKRGEILDPGVRISNEEAGLYLMAFDAKEPWGTHRRYQVFDDRHKDLFGRPEVTADRIVLCRTIMEAIEAASAGITNTLCAKYVLTQYFLMYCVRGVIEKDTPSEEILRDPEKFVRDLKSRDDLRACIRRIAEDMVGDLNDEINPLGDDFDYRDKMRDVQWVKDLSTRIVGDHMKLVRRGKINSLRADWDALQKPRRK
jgi:hypothetical protein